MLLTALESRILAAIELNADRSAPEIARLARTTSPTVYRTIDRLINRGVIVGKTAVIDISQLGLIEFGVNLSLAPKDLHAQNNLLKQMQKDSRVSWIAEVGGEFDLMCNIVAINPHSAKRILEELLEPHIQSILGRQICSRTKRVRYPRWFLGTQRKVAYRFSSGNELIHQELDSLDQKILIALSKITFESYRDLAQKLDIPLSTFLRRLQSLYKKNILLGFGYRFDLQKIEALQFRVLLSFRVANSKIRERLHIIAARERMIKLVVECLGSWDFELEIDQPKGEDVKRVTSLLHHEFHGELMNLSLIPIFRHVQYISFPAALVQKNSCS